MIEFADLLNLSESHRDVEWERAFLSQFARQNVIIESEDVRQGPDHWPYLFVQSGEKATESVWQVVDWLSHRGVGLAFNAQKALPDYVFTYGMIWNFKKTSSFQLGVSDRKEKQNSPLVFQPGQEIISGPPDTEYIPTYVREVLRQFFSDQGIKEGPRWLVVSGDRRHYDLCFSVESLGHPPKEEHMGIAESLSWFFPNHFSIVLVSEKHFPKFYDLDV